MVTYQKNTRSQKARENLKHCKELQMGDRVTGFLTNADLQELKMRETNSRSSLFMPLTLSNLG